MSSAATDLWIAAAPTLVGAAGMGTAMVVKMTRLVVAVEMLGKNLETIIAKVGDHEGRITRLESSE